MPKEVATVFTITDEWRVLISHPNYELQTYRLFAETKDKPERMDWGFVGYYSSLPQAIKMVADQMPGFKVLDDLYAYRDAVKDLADKIGAEHSKGENLNDG